MKVIPWTDRRLRCLLWQACLATLAFLPVQLSAQAELVCDGEVHTVEASGTFEDFIVPNDPEVTQIELIAHGADGGFASLGNCFSDGGAGAHVVAVFALGDGEDAIPYGSTVRFIVGVAGEKGTGGTVLGTGFTYGGGGGGTGIMFRPPDSDEWKVIVAAGGGGGAYQGSIVGLCIDSKAGQGGRATIAAGDGNGGNGGKGDLVGGGGMAGGLDGLEVAAGGGGAYTKGEGITCVDLGGGSEVAEGQAGFPNGGAGGDDEGCVGFTFRNGGFGFGGGGTGVGAGGGGGGFSGGGGGGNAGRGGGGGSFVQMMRLSEIITEGGTTDDTQNGFAQYRCIRPDDTGNDPPMVTCVDITVELALNTEGTAVLNADQISAEPLDNDLRYSLDIFEFSCAELGEQMVTLTAVDDQDRSASCTATVNVVDLLGPQLDCAPSMEVSCDTDISPEALGSPEASDNCSMAEVTFRDTVADGDCLEDQNLIRTWTATDEAGNTSTCDQVIARVDNIPPECVDCPADITVTCGEVPELPLVSATDNCDDAPTISVNVVSDQTSDGTCSEYEYTETRIFTVTDACGNSSEYVQQITVQDEEAPVCDNCPGDITVSCDQIPEMPKLTATDNCDPTPTIDIATSSTQTDGSCEYMIIRVFTVTDACGNSNEYVQQITVQDTEAPVCDNCPGDVTVSCGEVPPVPELTATDNCDPDPTIEIGAVTTRGGDGPCSEYSYTERRTFTVTDACGNSRQYEQLITVEDDEAPVCNNCPGDITVACGEVPPVPDLTATDNCDPNPTIEIGAVTTRGGDGPCSEYNYTERRTFTVTDACGNSRQYEQLITVEDDEAPVCDNCPGNIIVSCDNVPPLPELTATDNCDPNPTIAIGAVTTRGGDGPCSEYNYIETRTFTVTDACGNSRDYVQVITVMDEEAPVCENCPGDITVSCDEVPPLPELTITDNCDPNPTIAIAATTTRGAGDECTQYSYIERRIFTISDACGNSRTYEQNITVVDEKGPSITCPGTVTVTCDSDPAIAGSPEVSDNCDPDPDIDFSDVVLSGDCGIDCLVERTWTARDACGNESFCVQSIRQNIMGLLDDALDTDVDGDGLADPLVIGRVPRHSLTVTPEGAECLMGWLPNNGGRAWPLIRTNFVIDGTDCAPEGLPVGADGKLNNPLISETLLLAIKLRLDPELGEMQLSELDCNFHPIIFQGLPNNPTVGDLFRQANLVVGNIYGLPFTEQFADALACINGTFNLCNDEDAAARVQPVLPSVTTTLQAADWKLYPNPAQSRVWIELPNHIGQSGQLQISDVAGKVIVRQQIADAAGGQLSLPVDQLDNGMYLITIKFENERLTKPLVIQRH